MANNDQQFREVPFEESPETQPEPAREELESQEIAEQAQFEENQAIAEEEEIDYANQLALEREQEEEVEQQAEEVRSEGQSFGSPSFIKYFVLFFVLAVPNDAIDILELTGLLAFIAWFASLAFSMTSILVMWFTDHEQKRAEEYMKKIESFQGTVAHTARVGLRVAKLLRNTRIGQGARRNPLFKIILGVVAEMIPFISIFPWSSLSVILAYLDERKTYKNARNAAEDISPLSQQAAEMV